MEFLKNYNEFIACYKIIGAALYRSSYVLNDEFFKLIRKAVNTCLLLCYEEARNEIITQLSINNNGRVSLAKRIIDDIQTIERGLDKIVENNKILTEIEDIADERGRKAKIDSLCGIESDIFHSWLEMMAYKNMVYEGVEDYFDSAIRKELYQAPSLPQSATKTPDAQPTHGNRQSSQDIEDYIEEYSKLFSYLNEFSNEGIEFNVFNEGDNAKEERVLLSHNGNGKVRYKIDFANKEYQGELIDRFYRRKWQDYNVRWSADMFAKRELKRLSEFSSFLIGDHEDLFNDLRHYLDCRMFHDKRANPQSEENSHSRKIQHEPEQLSGLTKTRDYIKETIEGIHKDKWNYFFKEESDYIQFVNVFTDFLDGKKSALPKTHIILKRKSKTKMASVLAHFLRELRDEGPMNSDGAFFKTIIGSLHDFKDYSIKELGDYLPRKPKL